MDDAARAGLRELALRHRADVPIEHVPVAVRTGVLGPALRDVILGALVRAEADFRTNEEPGRRALVLVPPPAALVPVAERLTELTPELAAAVGLSPDEVVPPTFAGLLCSAHGHGDFLGPHADAPADRTEHGPGMRVLTMVLHLFRAPAAFTGGDLRLYDHQVIGGRSYTTSSFVDVPVHDDTLVAYRSSVRHEVTTVRMAPDAPFADRRFAISAFGTWAP